MRFFSVRRFCVFMIAWAVAGGFSGAASALENTWTYQRIDSLYIEIPDSWSPYSKKGSSGFYTGKPPSGGASVGSLVLLAGREKRNRYEDVLAPLRRSPGGSIEALFHEEEKVVGGKDAVLFTNEISRREKDEAARPFIRMRSVVWKEAAEDGVLLLAVGGDAALFDEHAAEIDRMISSVRFDEPPRPQPGGKLEGIGERTAFGELLLPPIDLPSIELESGEKKEGPAEEKTPRERPVFASDALLEEELRKAREALALRDEGALLLAKGDREGAMDRFRRSLANVPDEDLSAFVETLGRRASEEHKAEEGRVSLLRREGMELQRDGKLHEALTKYRESLAVNDDETVREIVLGLEKLLQERASALVAQGEAHEAGGRLEEARAAYAESLSRVDEEFVRRRIAAVERLIRERQEAASPERVFAATLRNEGKALEEEGRLYEALGKYRESLKSYEEQELLTRADALETELKERARASISEGGALQRAGRYAEALEKFRESRRYYPRSEVDEHIRKLEEFLKK